MKSNSNFARKIVLGVALLVIAGMMSLATAPADTPLSKDDITLLLLGSSPSSKIISMVQQRGVDFQVDPTLAKTFHDQGASDDLIDALQKAGNKAAAAKANPRAAASPSNPAPPGAASSGPAAPTPSPEASPGGKPNAPDAPEPPAAEPAPSAPSRASGAAPSSDEPVLHTRHSGDSESAPASTPAASPAAPSMRTSSEPVLHEAAKKDVTPETPPTASAPGLKDPDADGIQRIIHEFAAKEKIFRAARNNYTYHQINKVETLGGDNEITGTYEQEWDILYDDSGKRIEKVTYAPVNTLKDLIITKEDIEGFRNITPFVLTTDELPDYEIKYLGHVKVDQITAFVFNIRPKEIQKNRQYFQGIVWVDDRDFQIVKSEGKQVPQDKMKHGQENLFPRFTTWREQVDGKFWFPTYTMGDDTLYFSNGPPVHMKEIVRYTDYKQFKSGVRILTVESVDKQKNQTDSGFLLPRSELERDAAYASQKAPGIPLVPQVAGTIPAMAPLEITWRIVLVRPRNPLNIGAAARALANFGLLDMAVVAPFEPTWAEARTAAVGGDTVMASAVAVPKLLEATGDANLVIGTTTGSRRNIGREILSLTQFAAWLRRRKARGKAALLFGSEKTGLSNEDLSLCHALVRIPTTPDCPSMNLGQAVAVCAYELTRARIISARPPEVTVHRSEPANQQALDHIFQHASHVLEMSGYFHPKSRAAMLMKLRRTLLDLNLTCNDVRVLGGVLSQVMWKLERTRKGEP